MSLTAELLEVGIKQGFEPTSLSEAVVEEDNNGPTKRRVKVTLVAVGPGNTTDKAYYTQECIESGPPLFEGCRAFANHISALGKQIQPERLIEEEVGWYSDVLVEGEKLTAILNVMDGESLDKYWDRVKGAIAYAKKYPGRNIMGISIHAAGDFRPMDRGGEKWKGVFRFADVKSADIVTWPARGGEFTAVLSESEKPPIQEDCGAIFQTLKDHVAGLVQTDAPGAEETRRIVDKLGTALKFNKQEDKGMDPNNQQPASAPNDEALKTQAYKMASESHKKMAEAEVDPTKKAGLVQMSERYAKMAEAGVGASPAATPPGPVAPGHPAVSPAAPPATQSEEEAGKAEQAEAKQAEAEKKYVDLLTATLLEKSGLPQSKKDFFTTFLIEGEKNPEVIKSKLAAYQKTELMEANRGAGPHGAPRQAFVPTGEAKKELKDVRPGVSRILAGVKG